MMIKVVLSSRVEVIIIIIPVFLKDGTWRRSHHSLLVSSGAAIELNHLGWLKVYILIFVLTLFFKGRLFNVLAESFQLLRSYRFLALQHFTLFFRGCILESLAESFQLLRSDRSLALEEFALINIVLL